MENQNKPLCCQSKDENNDVNNDVKGLKQGIMYGLIPHAGCIAFLIFSIIGVTTATAVFRPLLMSRYFFYGLLGMSCIFAAISAGIYLRRHNLLSMQGVKAKKSYLAVLFGSTLFVNMLLFFVIFPYAANAGASFTGSAVAGMQTVSLAVDIPCSGHASLISGDLKAVEGVSEVKFSFPNTFTVYYDAEKVSEQDILNIDVFQTYPAEVLS
jgi:copper chaperone CopZ